MADLHVDWVKPIRMTKEGRHSLSLDVETVPAEPGVYVFFRREGKNTTRVVYVGRATNLQRRTAGHANNHALITALLQKRGTYYLMAGAFKPKPKQDAKSAIVTIERVIIRSCIEDGHPLINVAGTRIRTQHVISTRPRGAKWLQPAIGFEPRGRGPGNR